MPVSIFRQDEQHFIELREYAIAYVQYVANGGCTGTFTDTLIDKTIDVMMKVKANRDYIYERCGKEIPTYDEEGNKITSRH